jgi:hypothetical protein
MRRLLLTLLVAACGPIAALPAAPARVLEFTIVTAGRPTGWSEIRIEGDGRRLMHFTYNDRGRGPDLRSAAAFDERGAVRAYHATGHDYLKAPVDERVAVRAGQLTWSSMGEHGEAALGAGYYAPISTSDGSLERALLRAPGHRLALLPAGEAWIEDETRREIVIAGVTRHLHRIAVAGFGFAPYLAWLDEDDEPFASVSAWSSEVRVGAEAAIPTLVADDTAWNAARAARLAAQLAHRPPAAGLAIIHANLFDSERRTIVADATVLVRGDRITAVGDHATAIPAGAEVIDAHGRTLLPGLWDMHVHLSDGDGTLQLASGITTVRDLGNDIELLAARVARFDAGTELGPNVLRAGLIDGPGEFAAPTGVLVATADEARAAVRRFADAGYQQIKIYSSVDPALVPVIAEAAHARGLRLSGHVPMGMTAADAVRAGYDEIQHVNFLFLQFLVGPTDDTRTPVRFVRVAEGAAGLDLASPPVQAFLDLLVAHHTVLDPTLATFHGMFVDEPADLDPILAPYAGRLPAQVERSGHGNGLAAPDGERATFRASYAALLRMVKAAWDRQIPIVAGTDNLAGLTLPHELELYVRAGIPAADVLALATIGAARVMGVDREVGSIAVGKRADLVLVDGDPIRDIGAVRATRTVVCRGVVYDPAALFAAVGMRP